MEGPGEEVSGGQSPAVGVAPTIRTRGQTNNFVNRRRQPPHLPIPLILFLQEAAEAFQEQFYRAFR
jgi:hypothetical protein